MPDQERDGEDEGGIMRVEIGSVATFRDVRPDKAQVVKIAEEWGEVYSAWEKCTDEDLAPDCYHFKGSAHSDLVDECADVIQATCNLLASIGVEDMTWAMARCEERNRERGRL